jgi:hypothetical protein
VRSLPFLSDLTEVTFVSLPFSSICIVFVLVCVIKYVFVKSFLFGMSCRMKFMLSLLEGLLDLMHNYLQCLALLLLHFVPMLLLIGFYRYMLLVVCQASVLYVVNLVKMI